MRIPDLTVEFHLGTKRGPEGSEGQERAWGRVTRKKGTERQRGCSAGTGDYGGFAVIVAGSRESLLRLVSKAWRWGGAGTSGEAKALRGLVSKRWSMCVLK